MPKQMAIRISLGREIIAIAHAAEADPGWEAPDLLEVIAVVPADTPRDWMRQIAIQRNLILR